MNISIDFDDVLHDTATIVKGKHMGEPILGAKEALSALRKKGHRLIIFTVRGDQKYVRDWLKFFKIPFDEITDTKPDAVVYIDDRGLRFESWEQALSFLKILSK